MGKIMTSDYARKLSTDTLTNRLHKQPFNVTILNELNKRATKVFKCEIQAKIRLEKELAKRSNRAVIGYKTAPYFTEEEMINGFSCTYEQLSESEKLIHDKL
jgi:YesN/AraC family two-component response regulator